MKRVALISVCLLSLLSLADKADAEFWQEVKKGVCSRIVLHVIDDMGADVPGAAIKLTLSRFQKMDVRSFLTDEKGLCMSENVTCGNSIEAHVSKCGYYESRIQFSYIKMGEVHAISDGKWQPYPTEKTIVLRRVCKPRTLVRVNKIFDVPVTNKWIGFDMSAKDFVAPFGKGSVADFEYRAEWDGLPAWKSTYCAGAIRFVCPMSGGCYVANITESEFPYPYDANVPCHSITEIKVIERRGDPHTTGLKFREESSFVTRTRCSVDEGGIIQEANYGCIRQFCVGPSRRGKALLVLDYIFNPMVNDRNLEQRN